VNPRKGAYTQQGPHDLHWTTPSVSLTALHNSVRAISWFGVSSSAVVLNDLTSSASGLS
jgi:hypothetical protein